MRTRQAMISKGTTALKVIAAVVRALGDTIKCELQELLRKRLMLLDECKAGVITCIGSISSCMSSLMSSFEARIRIGLHIEVLKEVPELHVCEMMDRVFRLRQSSIPSSIPYVHHRFQSRGVHLSAACARFSRVRCCESRLTRCVIKRLTLCRIVVNLLRVISTTG